MYRPKCIINVASAFHNVGFNSGYKFPAISLYLRFRSLFSSFFRLIFARNFNSFCHFIGCAITNGMSQTEMIAFNCSKFAIIFCIRYNFPILTPSAPGVISSGRTLSFQEKQLANILFSNDSNNLLCRLYPPAFLWRLYCGLVAMLQYRHCFPGQFPLLLKFLYFFHI